MKVLIGYIFNHYPVSEALRIINQTECMLFMFYVDVGVSI